MYSEKENFIRVIKRDSPSHVCYPPPSKGLFYYGAWPGDLKPSPTAKSWKDIWGVTWIDEEGEAFPANPAVETYEKAAEINAPSPHSEKIKTELKKNYKQIDREKYFLSVNHPYFLYEKGFNILGAEEFLCLMAADEDAANQFLDTLLNFEMEIAKEYVKYKPEHINTSDDYGIQDRLALSPEMWRKYFKPRLKKLYDFYRSELGDDIVISHHSCGHVMPILEDFIEIGTTILNPLQTTANDLPKAAEITRGRLVIAGAIDGQQILPFGKPEDVRKEVFRKMNLFWKNGGFLPMAEKMLGVPEKNKIAMESAIREWSKKYVEKSPIYAA